MLTLFVKITHVNFVESSDARRFIFRQPAAACPKWPGVAAFRRRGTKFYQNLCFNFQAQKNCDERARVKQ